LLTIMRCRRRSGLGSARQITYDNPQPKSRSEELHYLLPQLWLVHQKASPNVL